MVSDTTLAYIADSNQTATGSRGFPFLLPFLILGTLPARVISVTDGLCRRFITLNWPKSWQSGKLLPTVRDTRQQQGSHTVSSNPDAPGAQVMVGGDYF